MGCMLGRLTQIVLWLARRTDSGGIHRAAMDVFVCGTSGELWPKH